MTLAILIIGLVIATCFIAYIADNIGKNLGKKRISIFGLRPRQTATLISMVSSVAIMLLTVGIIMATSLSVRNALLSYDAVRREANRQRRELETLLQQNKELQANSKTQSERITNQLKEIESNRKIAEQSEKERSSAEAQLKSASSRLATASKGATAARARLASARRQFQTSKAQLASAQTQVAAAKARAQKAQMQVQTAKTQLRNEQGRVASTRSLLVAAQQELVNAQEEVKLAQTRLEQTQSKFDEVQANVTKTREELQKAEQDIAELQVRRNYLQAEVDRKQLALSELEKSTGKYEIIIDRIGRREIATPLGELFAESTLPAGMSAGQMREELHDLMQEGRSRLANPPRNLKLAMPREAVLNKLSEDEYLNGFAAYLSTLNAPVSLRLLAARDYARGETEIFARLTPIIVRTIFDKDEVLESTTVDAAAGDARIFNQLLKLLNDAEQRARDRGVTPLLTPQSPHFYPTGTNERVFEALRQIQAVGGSVPVSLIAAEDITSVDSPRVRFEVGEPSPSQ